MLFTADCVPVVIILNICVVNFVVVSIHTINFEWKLMV